jgi:hypothetical protein
MRPTPDELIAIAMVAKGSPRFVAFVQRWMDEELRDLPKQQQNVAVKQGYCLALQELEKLLNPPAPPARQTVPQPSGKI